MRRAPQAAIIGIAAGAMGVTAASAQLKPEVQIGSRVAQRPVPVSKADAGCISQNFARCVYGRNRPRVDHLLRSSDMLTFNGLTGSFSGEQMRKDRLQLSECLGRQADPFTSQLGMQVPGRSMRAMLVEAAYVTEVRRLPVNNDASPPATRRSFASTGSDLVTATAMAELADCVVKADAVNADAPIRLVPSSPGELDQARKLAPALGGCVSDDQTFHLDAKTVRMVVADGLWQRYVASAAPIGSTH